MTNFYNKALLLSNEEFKRLTGVTKSLAEEMLALIKTEYARKHTRRGRKAKLSPEDMLMMTLKFWRQYPTFFELGFEFDLSKTRAQATVVWVENTLIKSGVFKLPGRKKLLEADNIEIVLVDVMEKPIERPKKNKEITIQARKSPTQLKRK